MYPCYTDEQRVSNLEEEARVVGRSARCAAVGVAEDEKVLIGSVVSQLVKGRPGSTRRSAHESHRHQAEGKHQVSFRIRYISVLDFCRWRT